MTYREAVKTFKREIQFTLNAQDRSALSEAWCNWIDTLHRDGQITNKQAQNWGNPFSK